MRAVRPDGADLREGGQANGRHSQFRARPRRRRVHQAGAVSGLDEGAARRRPPRAQDAQPVHEEEREDRRGVPQQHRLAQAHRRVRRQLAPRRSRDAHRGRGRAREGANRRRPPPGRGARHRQGNNRIALQVPRAALSRTRRVRRGSRLRRPRRPRIGPGAGRFRDDRATRAPAVPNGGRGRRRREARRRDERSLARGVHRIERPRCRARGRRAGGFRPARG
mmetsp:Transcript_2349/g.10086  ORF Transcript_2349/g.10086 Transcript_2349/m.10086 type:complete len:222 (+) Transcript_2349:197-862(+)